MLQQQLQQLSTVPHNSNHERRGVVGAYGRIGVCLCLNEQVDNLRMTTVYRKPECCVAVDVPGVRQRTTLQQPLNSTQITFA